MKGVLLSVMLLVQSVAYSAAHDPPRIRSGFFSGNEYLQLSEAEQEYYIVGYVDALNASPGVYFSNAREEWLSCFTEMTNHQVHAIVRKYLDKNPGKWQNPMNILALYAFQDVCGTTTDVGG